MSLEALLQYWSSQKLSKAPGVSEQEIEAFEKRYRIRIHHEFRQYLSTVNGMIEADNCDSNLFAFWTLEKIKPVADECPELEGAKGHESYFVFADYMIWSWAYAINLDANSSDAGEVILVGGRRPQRVARSFFDFIGLYVQDSKDLYASA